MVRSLRIACAAAVVTAVCFAPGAAEARFGKRSESSEHKTTHRSGAPGSSSPAPAPADHGHRRSHDRHAGHVAHVAVAMLFGHHHSHYTPPGLLIFAAPPPPVVYAVAQPPPPPPPPPPAAQIDSGGRFEFGGIAQGHAEGAAVGFGLAAEGRRWGVNFGGTSILALAEDGSHRFDKIQLLDAHLTFALVSSDRLRIRVEGGVSGAIAPDLGVLGPDAGASATLRVIGPFGVEASGSITPWPFRKVDARAGGYVALGALHLQGGWRTLYLNDAGLLGGECNVDRFNGPFIGASLVF